MEAGDSAACNPSEVCVEGITEPSTAEQPEGVPKKGLFTKIARVAVSASRPVKREMPTRDHGAEKQRLVRTIALGNLSASTRTLAVKLAKAAGKVRHRVSFNTLIPAVS